MAVLRTKVPPTGRMQVSATALLVIAALVLLGVGILVVLQRALPSATQLLSRPAPPPVRLAAVPEVLKPPARAYAAPTSPPAPPVAQAVPKPQLPPAPPPAPPPTPPVAQQATPTPDFLEAWKQREQAVTDAMRQQTATLPAQPVAKMEKPKREAWIITPTDITLKQPEGNKEGKELTGKEKDTLAAKGAASQLIKPATWAIPRRPLVTIYRSMSLATRTLDDINSDIPGQVRLALTIPLYDKFGRGTEILPKGTLIIATQEGKPEFGQSRLGLKIEQLELPSGEVLSLKSTGADDNGASGVTGRVDQHWGKLIGATALSAVLNIGARAAAGTPGQGAYFQNPVQSAAGDIGQSVQRDAQSFIDKTLRVPPTIVVPSGAICSVNVLENITLSQRPVLIR